MNENKQEPPRPNFALKRADVFIFAALFCLLILSIFLFAKANIRTDSVDYYTILQRLTDGSKKPVVDNTHFVEQRSPGYGIISMLPYYFASFAIEPFVKTEKIVEEKGMPPPPPKPGSNMQREVNRPPRPGDGSEMMGIPNTPLLARDIFFKNFYIKRTGGWFEWKIIFALLLTSYVLLFAGIVFSAKALAFENKGMPIFSLPLLVIFSSFIFIHNIINTPVYATLTAFGLSAIFCHFFVRGWSEKEKFFVQFLAGLFLGLLVLTRLETVLIAGVLCFFLIFYRKWAFLKNIILGGSLSLIILFLYNSSQFGTPLHFGILKGDINQIGFDLKYVLANIVNPKSGIIFWSPLVSLGLAGLFFGKKEHLIALGISSLIFIAVMVVRVPVMYKCMGGDAIDIGGIAVACFKTTEDALMLIRSDANRYITVLAPFAILGLQNLLGIFGKYFRPGSKTAKIV